jgi:hypothetical protein
MKLFGSNKPILENTKCSCAEGLNEEMGLRQELPSIQSFGVLFKYLLSLWSLLKWDRFETSLSEQVACWLSYIKDQDSCDLGMQINF